MDWVGLIISLISGAIGGNVAGGLMKDKSLGTAGNSIAGVLGGAGVGALLQAIGLGGASGSTSGAGVNLAGVLGNLIGGGAGGGILMAIIAAFKGGTVRKA